MPKVFVLMPFDDDFQGVYERLFRAPFEAAGYDVSRADDITNQRSILADIVNSIEQSDFILADLTLSNPNVYYELGIAHTLGKRVVLVAQDLATVPFDLRSYRVVEYSVHFEKMEKSIQEMEERARKILAGEVEFGNPVEDFASPLRTSRRGSETAENSDTDEDEEEDGQEEDEPAGILDLQADLEGNLGTLSRLVEESGERLEAMNSRLRSANERITGVELGQPQRQRRTIRKLGTSLKADAEWFAKFNESYCDALAEVEACFGGLFGPRRGQLGEEERTKIAEFVEVSSQSGKQIEGAVDSFGQLLQSMRELPRIERTFDKASRLLAGEVDTYIDNLELSGAVMSRAQNLAKRLLRG